MERKRLVILIGSSGSGKTYFANWVKERDTRYKVISSDSHRKERTGSFDNIFKNPIKHFKSLDRELLKLLDENDYVILDAVNISRFRRKFIFKEVKKRDIEVIGVEFHVPIKRCIKQDKSELRGHEVGWLVILLMKICSILNKPKMEEGFDFLVTKKGFIDVFMCSSKG